MLGRLSGKRCLVTAAGAGIGRAVAVAFAAEGARVVATDIDATALAALHRDTPAVAVERLDVRDAGAVTRYAERPFDVLVNVAGTVPSGTILDWTHDEWSCVLDLNVTAMIRLIQGVLPGMIARGCGSIVNMASVASSITTIPNRFLYGTTKAAVIGLTKAVAVDFVRHGVRCNAIAPGTIDTPSLHARLGATGDYAAAHAHAVARLPVGRFGRAEEVAALAVHLAGDESAFTTGQVYVIDGGWAM